MGSTSRFTKLLKSGNTRARYKSVSADGTFCFKNHPRAFYDGPQKDGFIKNSKGNWEYDHTQDLDWLEADRLKAVATSKARELKDSLPRTQPKRLTLANTQRNR